MYDSSPSFITTDANCQKLSSTPIVTPRQRLWWHADRAWHETYFFSILLTQVRCSFHIILCFFGFHPNHFPFRSLSLLTLFTLALPFLFWGFFACACSRWPSPSGFTGTPSASLHQTMTSGVSVSPSGPSLHPSLPATAAHEASSVVSSLSCIFLEDPELTSSVPSTQMTRRRQGHVSNFPILATFSLYPFHLDIASTSSSPCLFTDSYF